MSDGPNESMNAAVSSGAEADPVTGFAHSVARLTSTAPVSPLATFLIVLIRPMIRPLATVKRLCLGQESYATFCGLSLDAVPAKTVGYPIVRRRSVRPVR